MEVRESEELMDVYNYSLCMVQRQLYVSNEILSYSKCYGPIES